MSDRRRHRGPHPADAELFGADALPSLRVATSELSWLLERGYKMPSALALVGDQHGLRRRQRLAVQRSACTAGQREARGARRLQPSGLTGRGALIDGFNCIIAIEAALSGGVLLLGRDRVLRDMASVHGSYRRVQETERAIELLAQTLASNGCARALWLLDRPVSNSGRLAAMIRELASPQLSIEVELDNNPDKRLINEGGDDVVCSGDSWVLDGVSDWLDLPAAVLSHHELDPWTVDMAA